VASQGKLKRHDSSVKNKGLAGAKSKRPDNVATRNELHGEQRANTVSRARRFLEENAPKLGTLTQVELERKGVRVLRVRAAMFTCSPTF
jgi:hypothetical protein